MPKGIPFLGEYKQRVVEDIRNNNLSYEETIRKYGIKGKVTIQRWERIYLEEGPRGLYVERRGRGGRWGMQKLNSDLKEDLIAENQRLRAENEYLRKLNALLLDENKDAEDACELEVLV